MADYDLEDIKGVSGARADKLADAGFPTVDDIATASPDDLTTVSGIGSATAPDLIAEAQALITDTVEDEADTDDEVETDEVESMSEEEMDELVETDTPDDDQWDEEAVEEEPDELEDELEDEPPADGTDDHYPVVLALETHDQYDHLYYTLIDLRRGVFNMTANQTRLADDVLDGLRPLDGVGEIELPLSRAELNALHAALTQTKEAYQGNNDVTAFEAIQAVTEQVQAAREEYIL